MNHLLFLITRRFSSKKNSTISFISKISNIGIFISIFSLVISFSALNGFQYLINKTLISILPHGVIKFVPNSLFTWKKIVSVLQNSSDISYIEPFIISDAVVIKNQKVEFIQLKSFQSLNLLKKKSSLMREKTIFRQIFTT